MDRSTDAQIVERVLRGDAELYAELVERYRDRYARYALHMLGNREDAEEALQDAFTRAYRSLARCEDPERFGAWLFRILVNRCRTVGARTATANDHGAAGPVEPRGHTDLCRRALGRSCDRHCSRLASREPTERRFRRSQRQRSLHDEASSAIRPRCADRPQSASRG